jgi:hypothetical protein
LHSWQASVIFGRTSVAATMECLSMTRATDSLIG